MHRKWLTCSRGLALALLVFAGLGVAHAQEPRRVGPPVVVIIDSGVAPDHPAFHDRWLTASEVAKRLPTGLSAGGDGPWPGWDFLTHSPRLRDPSGHGTHVAGVIADALARGGAACATVRLVMLRSGDKHQRLEDVTAAVEAVSAMCDLGWDIPVVLCAFEYRRSPKDDLAFLKLKQAFGQLLSHDTTCVCAAGNQSVDIDTLPNALGLFPASFHGPGLIAVAACGSDGQLLATSDYGPTSVLLAAPGLAVPAAAASGGNESRSGTSQAAASVAGALARHAAETGDRQPAALRAWLISQTKHHPSLIGRVASGSALLPGK